MNAQQRLRAMKIEKEILFRERWTRTHLDKGRIFLAQRDISKMVDLAYEYGELTDMPWRKVRRTIYANIQ